MIYDLAVHHRCKAKDGTRTRALAELMLPCAFSVLVVVKVRQHQLRVASPCPPARPYQAICQWQDVGQEPREHIYASLVPAELTLLQCRCNKLTLLVALHRDHHSPTRWSENALKVQMSLQATADVQRGTSRRHPR